MFGFTFVFIFILQPKANISFKSDRFGRLEKMIMLKCLFYIVGASTVIANTLVPRQNESFIGLCIIPCAFYIRGICKKLMHFVSPRATCFNKIASPQLALKPGGSTQRLSDRGVPSESQLLNIFKNHRCAARNRASLITGELVGLREKEGKKGKKKG